MSTETPLPTQQARLKGLTAAFLAFLSVALVASLAAIGFLVLQVNHQAEQNFDVLKGIQSVNDRLIDCTDPTGKCAQESQARTGEAVVGINEGTLRVIVAALSCQDDGITGQRELSRCTVKRAQAESDQP